MANVTMTEAAAKSIAAFYDDLMLIQQNAYCSDQYFRNHIMGVIRGHQTQEAFKEVKAAVEAAAEKPKEAPKRSKLAKYDNDD